MAKNFKEFDYTYGVGMEFKATSAKQVKDQLKLNLDTLSKMVKSYGKVLKIDPDADLSKLFDEMRKIQGLVDGINNSDNSFAGFVDKGTLSRIADLESGLATINATSKEVEASLAGLTSSVASMTEMLKAAGAIKFPATFDNLFGNVKDQSDNIKQVTDQLKQLEQIQKKLADMRAQIDRSSGLDVSHNHGISDEAINEYDELITKFDDLSKKLKSANTSELPTLIKQYQNIVSQMKQTMTNMSSEQFEDILVFDEYLSSIDAVIHGVEEKRTLLSKELTKLQAEQKNFVAKTSTSGKSLGVQTDYTAQVKVTPKTNESEWAKTINDTIKNIEPNLKPVHLIPTFSKGKNIKKEVEGNLAQINHAVNVDLKVTDNIEEFDKEIERVDKHIRNAKKQLEQAGNFKIRFEYEEGGKFKDAAYGIINKFKRIDTKFYIANGKSFINAVSDIKKSVDSKLKELHANIVLKNEENILANVDSLRTKIEEKIGNIGVNLFTKNTPEFMSQIDAITSSVDVDSGINNATNKMEELSETAKKTNDALIKIKQTLSSLTKEGFNSTAFVDLGFVNANGTKIKGSSVELKKILDEYNTLKKKIVGNKSKEEWLNLYPEANGNFEAARKLIAQDNNRVKELEASLNQYLQRQIAALTKRQQILEKTLQTENQLSKQKGKSQAEIEASRSLENAQRLRAEAQKTFDMLQKGKLGNNRYNFKSLINSGLGDINKVLGSGSTQEDLKKSIDLYYQLIEAQDELRKSGGKNSADSRDNLATLHQLKELFKQIYQDQIKYCESKIKEYSIEEEKAKNALEAAKKLSAETNKNVGESKNNTQVNNNIDQLAISADEAKTKIKSLNTTLAHQRKYLQDLENSKGWKNSAAFTKLGEWDSKTGTFKKNKKDIEELIDKYNKLRDARIKAGGANKTVVGEEASLRSKLSAIYRQQKQHLAEVIKENEKELETAKKIVEQYKKAGNYQNQNSKTNNNAKSSTKHLDELIVKLNKAKEAYKLLKSSGVDALSNTGLGDVKGRLKNSSQNLNELLQSYNELIAKKKEFEAKGDTTSSSYTSTVNALEGIKKQLGIIYRDQIKYTENAIKDLDAEIAKEKELLQIQTQQTKESVKQTEEAKKQAQQPSVQKKVQATTPVNNTVANSNLTSVQLDSATLNTLAKDTTLKAIDGKINGIMQKLGNGIKITGSNISIEASNVNVKGGTKTTTGSGGTKQDAGSKEVKESTLSGYTRQLTVFEEQIKRSGLYTDEFKQRLESLHKTLEKAKVQNDVDAYKIDLDRFKEDFEQLKSYNNLYQDFVKSQSKQIQLRYNIANTDGPTAKMQEQLKTEEEISRNLEVQMSQYATLYTQRSRQLAIEEAINKANQEIATASADQSDKEIKKQNADLAKIVNNAQKKLNDMQHSMNNLKIPMAEPATAKLKEYEQLLTTLQRKQQEIVANPDLLNNESYSKGFLSLLQQMQKVEGEFITLQKSSESFLNKIRSIEDIQPLDKTFDATNLEQMHDAMQAFANQAGVGAAKLIEFNDAERTATFEIKNGRGQVQQLTVAYDAATNSLGRFATQTKTSLSETQKFFNSLKHSFQNVARYLVSFGSVYRIFSMIRQGVTYVKEIDSALTELKKVTDETNASYDRFLQSMSKTASVIGSSVADLTTMAAEWARLGYSMADSAKLAESTAILLNVSEFEDATKASEALISTMQAFSYTADQSQHVVDILNEVGNNFAVSSDGIATALQDSASALMEGGNNLEQAVALVAAANRVVQDPNSVGSALRTISLRLRGTSVKILEEMGEETEGVVESTSKLQEKIQALSGVNILTDAGAYKDTYTILKEIGTVWEDMSDIDQAALLELMAGKNRANTLSAILSNMEDLNGAYESALNAEGSALKENESHLNSIQGRIELFTNSVQTMWMNTLNNDVVKGIIDLGTNLINLIDKLGLVKTTVAGILTYITAFSKHRIDLASALGIHRLDDTFLKGFSAIGQQGLTGRIAEFFKPKSKNNVVNTILGSPSDIKVSVQDFADSIRDNINDYVTVDTTQIDTAIDSVQHKLVAARQHLADAKQFMKRDFYDRLGSRTPAKDRDSHIAEKQQEIADLESQLAKLQAKRDQIVTSAVNNVAGSMVNSINNETKAYQSMLSVLSEVQNKKLYLGNEQDAAVKIDAMSAAAKNGQTALVNYVSSLNDTDIALKAYAASVEDGNYSLAGFQQFIQKHNAGIKASGVAAKAAAVGHQLLNTALSMGISLIASFAIQALVKGIDELVKTSEEAAEAAEDAVNAYQNAQKTLQNQKKTIDELSDAYERLSKGVDLNTNENLNLTTDSYQEYLDICNEIADMYPHLVTGFDAQGNAILSLKGNVDALVQAYRDAAQAARQQMLASGDDIFDTFKNNYSSGGAPYTASGIKQQLEVAQELQRAIESNNKDTMQTIYDDLFNNHKYALDGMLEKAGIEYSDLRSGFDGDIKVESFKQQSQKILSFIKSTTTQINLETSKVKSLMSAYLGEDFDYAQLSDKSRVFVDQIVSSLNADFINKFSDADTLYVWIKDNIVDAFQNPDVISAISSLSNVQLEFSKGDISYSNYKKQLNAYISQIQNKVDKDALAQIKLGIGIDEESLEIAANHVLKLIGDDRQGVNLKKIWSLSVEDLQIAGQLEVPEGTILTWEELQKAIENTKIAATQDFDITNYTKSISGLSAQISEYQEALQKLDKGSFTMNDFIELIEKYPELAKGVDVSSNAFYGLSRNLNRAIKTSTKDFIRDLQELRESLIAAGKSTSAIDQLIESIENMPDDALDDTIEQYSTLADKINRARLAQDRLISSMEENPNEGYETRGEAMEYMKTAMEMGEIGSESNLWNVAERYGFTYDSAKTINENANALAEFIAARQKWFKQDDDGNYTYQGTESFISDVESAVTNNAELQKYLTWNYDESTGTLTFDYDNEDWNTIVSLLGKTKELTGLTSDEFADLMIQVGQYFNIKWGNYDDVLDHLNGIATGSSDAKTKVEEYGQAMQDYFGGDTTIDLSKRPVVSGTEMQSVGWTEVEDDSHATVYTSTFSNEDGTKSIVVTPILPDGTVLSPEQLEDYANKLLSGETIDPDIDIKLAEFDGTNSIQEANKYAEALHQAQEEYDKLRDTLKINDTIDEKGLGGLKEIKEVQDSIITKTDGTVVIDEEAFTKALEDAQYTEDQIDVIIEKIKNLNKEAFNIDPFKVEDVLDTYGVEGLEGIGKVRDALTKDATTGLTVFDTDMFTSVLQDAGYTKDQIDALIKKIQEYNGIVSTSSNTDPLGLSNVNFNIDTLKASLSTLGVQFDETIGTWGDGKKDLTIDVTDLATTLKAKGWTDQSIKDYFTKLSETNLEGFNIKVNQEEIDAAIEKANEVPEEETTKYLVTGTGYKDLANIDATWSEVTKDKSTNYTIYETTIKKTETEDEGFNLFKPSTWFANGTAHANGSWGAPKTETALTGELGPEILVRNGRWTTVGENGAEFTQVKKGDIIFNHKQSEELLKNGYVTGRGKLHGGSAFASGTAYSEGDSTRDVFRWEDTEGTLYLYDGLGLDENNEIVDYAAALAEETEKAADAASEFEETFDWVEVRLEEIDEDLNIMNAQLENASTYAEKNNIIDSIIGINETKISNLTAGIQKYTEYAAGLLAEVPRQYQEAAQNGAIAISEFAGEADETTVKAINKYREWAQKVSDLKQELEGVKTEIRDLAIQKFENIQRSYSVKVDIEDSQNSMLQDRIDLLETSGEIAAAAYYESMKTNSDAKIKLLTEERKKLDQELINAVASGAIEKYSDEWYELANQLYEVQGELDAVTKELEEFQNAINQIYWDNFDELINRLDYISDETQNLIDLMSRDDLFNMPDGNTYEGGRIKFWTEDEVEWTKDGITALGLYAQQMEVAEFKAKQYTEAVQDLTSEYEKGNYSESEYLAKLNELKDAQYEAIQNYYNAQDAIKDLNKKRIDHIKDGIEKELDAYEELIDKQKELLDSEKDLHDFERSIQESQKDISEIRRKLVALENDNSMSAIAERKKLQAELAEAEYELEEKYLDRSYQDKQNALDQELEDFQTEKDAEMTKWEEYLNNTEALLTDTLTLVQANALLVHDTLLAKATEYGLTLSDNIKSPWQEGQLAIDGYNDTFNTTVSANMNQLGALKSKWQELIDKMQEEAKDYSKPVSSGNYFSSTSSTGKGAYKGAPIGSTVVQESEKPAEPAKPEAPVETPSNLSKGDTVTVDPKATHFTRDGGKGTKMASFVPGSSYTVYGTSGNEVLIGRDGVYTGWVKKDDLVGYSKGTKGVKNDELAWIDELGEELVLHADGSGRLSYLTKGTSVIPHDISENLMQLGQLDPSDILSRNTPQLGLSPSVVNNEIKLTLEVGEVVHIDTVTNDTMPNLTKAIEKQMDKYMKNINNNIRKYAR